MPVWAPGAAWAKETSLSMLPARIRPAPLAVARRYHGLSGPYAVASAATLVVGETGEDSVVGGIQRRNLSTWAGHH